MAPVTSQRTIGDYLSREEILREIFGPETGWYGTTEFELEAPSYAQLEEFADLLGSDPVEERLQKFLARNPQIVTGNYGWGDDSTLAFFVKPPVGNRFFADFSVLHFGQGGCSVHLVEIERSSHRLFNKDLSAGTPLRKAQKQVEDWHQWITVNKETFVHDALDAAKRLPPFPERAEGGSYRTRDSAAIEEAWQAFGGYEDPAFHYHVVIGRWSRLDNDEQRRLIFLNRQANRLHDVTTYDQLARRAFDRPTRRY